MAFFDKAASLKNIVFISIPDNLEQKIGSFSIDPTVLLPVEVPDSQKEFELGQLSWEQIATALCKIIAYDPGHKSIDYYKHFLLAIRPEIETELSLGGVKKADQKEFTLAEELFLVLKNLFPENPGHRLNLALTLENHSQLYADLGKQTTAEEYREYAFGEYAEILQIAPDSTDAQFNAGHFFFKNGNYDRALSCFKAYLEKGTDEKRRKLLSEIVSKLEQQHSADDQFKQAYDFIVMEQEEKGIEKIGEFLTQRPDVWNAWFLKGWAERRIGDYAQAKADFEKALSLTDENVDLLNELAICAMETGNFKESRKHLSSALSMEPENIKIISNLGILAIKSGDIEEARGFFRTVLEFDENDEIARKYLEYLNSEQE
ncbi:MAG: tetratricopeptide repeat protein [Spirochaetales bacterium]|nr:tetratricopeptide repeat protein [Spirochaetales bacterium]